MATSAAGLSAAYSTEINDCSFNADLGTRIRSRPQSFCDSVDVGGVLTAASSVTIAGPLTTSTTAAFGGNVSVTGAVIINGVSFAPGLMSVGTQPTAPSEGYGAGQEAPVVTGILSAGGTPIDVPALEPATTTQLGGVIVGDGLNVSANGTLSAPHSHGASVTISPTPPANPVQGDLWWNDTDGDLFIYYDDGNSQQWVGAMALPGIPESPSFDNVTISGNLSIGGAATLDAGAY